MTTVRIVDGMKYGYKLLGIFIAVALICGAFVAGGIATYLYARSLVNPPTTEYYGLVGAGATLVVVGGLGLYGGIVGLLHKFIADSVVAGMENADLSDGSIQPSISATTTEETAADDSESVETAEESADEGTEDDDSTDEGVFGIDTSKTRAEPTEPRQRQQAPAETTATAATPDPDEETDEGTTTPAADEPSGQAQDPVDTEEAVESPGADHSGPATRPGTPDQRSWEDDESGSAGSTEDGYPKQPDFDSTGESDDWDAGAEHQQPPEGYEDDPSPVDDNSSSDEESDLWDEEEHEDDIDDVVGEATRPDPTEMSETADDSGAAFDDETTTTGAESAESEFDEAPTTDRENAETEFDTTAESADAGTAFEDETATAESASSDPGPESHLEPDPNAGDTGEVSSEPQNIDEAPGKFVAKPPADTSPDEDEADDGDDEEDTTEEFPDDPIVDDGIEDTSDEEGDWEPLDESDL